MKKIFYIFISLLVLSFTGCSQYALQEDLEALQKEVAELKAMVEDLNGDVAALNTFMAAYNGCKMVTHVVETSYGWTIYFNDDTYCDLRHGKDGDKGEAGDKGDKGDVPVIGVKQDTDGVWYWTLNGEFLLMDGKKVPTTGEDGKDAPTPKFQVAEGNMLQVSYDNGSTWQNVGEVEGVSTVPSAVTDVIVTEDEVTFVLAEGDSLVMAMYKPLKITVAAPVASGNVYTAEYTLVGAGENVQVVCSPNEGWKASVARKDAVSGTITLTAPAEWVDASVLVFAYSDEQIAMTVISITQDKIEIGQNEYPATSDGGSFQVPVSANFVPYVSTTAEWVSVVEIKAMTEYKYTVAVDPNETEMERSAAVNFYKGEGGALVASIAIKQEGKKAASAEPVTLAVSADLSGSIWQETSVAAITVTSEEALNEAGDKTLEVVSGSVTVLPVSSLKVDFTLANGQAFSYQTALPENGQIALSGLDTLVEAGSVVPVYYNLAGAEGTARANCYIVLDGGYYKFPADFLNDGTTAIDAVSADWLWSEGEASLLSGVSLADKYVQFCVKANTKGNAAIATKAQAGHISWSWHIWMLQEDPTASHHYARNVQNYPLMNYHLGATTTEATVDAFGLYYQWGRKDPFPRANTIGHATDAAAENGQFGNLTLAHVENTTVFEGLQFAKGSVSGDLTDIQFAIQNPTTFLQATTDNKIGAEAWLSTSALEDVRDLWNNSHDGTNQDLNAIKSTDKTNYDPCPAGYIVPSSARMVWHNSTEWKFDNCSFSTPFNSSFLFKNTTDQTSAYYPSCGVRSDGKLQQLGQHGSLWASYSLTASSRFQGQICRIEISAAQYDDQGKATSAMKIGSASQRSAWALPVRCCKIVD